MPLGGYSQSWTENLRTIHIGEGAVMYTNPILEAERFARALPLLRRHGRMYTEHASTEDTYLSSLPPKLLAGRCYDAAYYLVAQYPSELVYCEGFCLFATAHVEEGAALLAHGWAVDKKGRIVDPTLMRAAQKKALYVGVPLRLEYAAREAQSTGYLGLLDGRLDSAPRGVYYDPPSAWLQG